MTGRRDRAEARLAALEAAYLDLLVSALKDCAAGAWGLLSEPAGPSSREMQRHQPAAVADLEALARAIADARDQLGYAEPFEPHVRLVLERTTRDQNQPGEPARALLWLSRLEPA